MTVINIIGVLVNLLLEIDPELYGPFVTTDKKREKVVIIKFMNSIYGTMVASLIYFKNF